MTFRSLTMPCWCSSVASPRVTQLHRRQLAAMEQQLSLEETAHFRVAIAARHSTCIRGDPAILWHAFHAVDAIISNLGMLQIVSVSTLVQKERKSYAARRHAWESSFLSDPHAPLRTQPPRGLPKLKSNTPDKCRSQDSMTHSSDTPLFKPVLCACFNALIITGTHI